MRRTGLRRTHLRGDVQRNHEHHKSNVCDTINDLINICCATAGTDTLTLRQQYRDITLRAQLNLILQSGPGSLKSTMLEEIATKHTVTPYSYVTYAAMIGTIDQTTGDLIPGLVWQTRRKPLLLDEFRTGERGDTGSIDVLLGVLESGLYKRKVGQKTRPYSQEDGDLYYRVKDGEIEVKTRFPCIIATMKNLDKMRSEKYEALAQRCIPARFSLTPEELDDILEGKRFYEYRKYDVGPNLVLSRRDYSDICSVAKKFRAENLSFQAVYARAVGDLCRIAAVLGFIDVRLSLLVCYLKSGYKIDQALDLTEKNVREYR